MSVVRRASDSSESDSYCSRNNESDSENRQNGTYITTASETERPVRVSVLGNQQFHVPKLDTLQRASVFRLSHFSKAKKQQKSRISRRRRNHRDASSGSESEVEQYNRSFNTEKDDYAEFDEDYDFDDDGFLENNPNNKLQENESQEIYKRMCSDLNSMVSNYFLRHLVTTEIVIKHSILGPDGAKACCAALLNNTTVRTLHFEDNDIGPTGTRYIAELLAENLYISNLGVAENNIGTEGLLTLKPVLLSNETIVKLDISGNNFSETDAEHIADILEENTVLKTLILKHNTFRENGGIYLARGVSNNDSLEHLDLSWNHLRRRGVAAIAEAITKNLGIISLNVSWNGFYLDGCKALSKTLKENKTVEHLDLTCNRINLECLTELIRGLKDNTTLTTLKLSNNPISSNGASMLLEMVEKNPQCQIREIDIRTQCIDIPFLRIMDRIRDAERRIRVRHGIILDQAGSCDDLDLEFLHEDPMMVLMECMHMMNLRLIDLFSSLDKDQSRSLTHAEIKGGLMSVHVPMSEKAIDRLIRKLDIDGDGEVDYGELLEGQKLHQKKLRRLKNLESELPFEETELGRIHFKIKKLMSHQLAIQHTQRAKERLTAVKNANIFVRDTAKTSDPPKSKQ